MHVCMYEKSRLYLTVNRTENAYFLFSNIHHHKTKRILSSNYICVLWLQTVNLTGGSLGY